jgi:ribose transport system ATP-binding protein
MLSSTADSIGADAALPAGAPNEILSVHQLSKSYGATLALRAVSLHVSRGEIHALLGENGAGKSTLVKILSGIVRPDSGRVEIDGKEFSPATLMHARTSGVSTAFQELSLLPNLSVADNLMLPRLAKGFGGRASVSVNRRAAAAILHSFGVVDIAPAGLVEDLSLAQKQRLEIVRALSHRPRFLILDEPTAALAEPEWLFRQLERIATDGTAILYITHRLGEVRRLCARATILRNGENVRTVDLERVADSEILAAIAGVAPARHVARQPWKEQTASDFALRTRNLSGAGVADINLDLRQGEIVGVAALEGQGQRELFRMLVGAAPITSGNVAVCGRDIWPASPAQALREGIAFLPEERKTEGLFLGLDVSANISVSILERLHRFGILDQAREHSYAAVQAREVDLAERSLRVPMTALSGGNQQKALLARVLLSGARILVLFDPTRGVDVNTKRVIYEVIRRFAANGGSVLIYSTELEELVQLVDRCVVIYRGRIVGEVEAEALSQEKLITLAFGHGNSDSPSLEAKIWQLSIRLIKQMARKREWVPAALFVVLFSVYAAHQPGALTLSAITNLCNNALPLALAAAGGTLVVLTRGFDLSVAGVVALCNVLLVTSLGAQQWAPLFGLAMVVTVGVTVGAINGYLVAYAGLQSVVATLATMIICSGVALLILETPGGSVSNFIAEDLTGRIGGYLPVAALIAAVVALLWRAIRRTDWGVALYAVGADETAAELAGISTRSVKLLVYCAAGGLYGLSGYMLTALTASGDPNAGNAYLIMAFAAIAIGGTSFNGGRGGVIGSMIGAAILTLMLKTLFSIGVLSFSTGIVQGLIMILGVFGGAQTVRVASWRH